MNERWKNHTGLDPPDRGGAGADPEMRGTGTSEGSGLHQRAHLKEAVYIRDLALGQKKMILPEEAEALLGQFLKLNLSLGQDINQATRICRKKGSFSAKQYKELTAFLEKLNSNYEKLNERILEVIKENGDHETAPP